DAGNYCSDVIMASTTANITPFTLIVNFRGVDRIYNDTTVANVTESDNHLAGDDVTVSYGIAYFDDKNVGTGKRVTVTGIHVGGVDAGNYAYSISAESAAKKAGSTRTGRRAASPADKTAKNARNTVIEGYRGGHGGCHTSKDAE